MRKARGLTLLEIIVVIVIIAIASALVLPLMKGNRTPALRTQCASNLRQILAAMYLYSDSPSNGGYFPTDAPTTSDPFAASGGASTMGTLYRQYVSDPRIFSCPSNPIPPKPKVSSIQPWPTGNTPLMPILKPEQTSYAYDPGHSDKTSAYVGILADKPGPKGKSENHGSLGQNVGFGTSVEFRESVQNPLDAKGARSDPNIFERNPELARDEDSFIRQ